MRELTSLGQAIADSTRVRILAALQHGELCVCELADALEISQSTLSGHLRVLRRTGMVITRKEGRWIYYSFDERKAALIEAIFSHIRSDFDRNLSSAVIPSGSSGAWQFVKMGVAFSASRNWKDVRQN
jgi:ArsR family transcriptional regulator, arsenate/arsenite/antimonite-responsive transcriptional repressor